MRLIICLRIYKKKPELGILLKNFPSLFWKIPYHALDDRPQQIPAITGLIHLRIIHLVMAAFPRGLREAQNPVIHHVIQEKDHRRPARARDI